MERNVLRKGATWNQIPKIELDLNAKDLELNTKEC